MMAATIAAGPALWFGAPWTDVLTGIGTVALAAFAVVTVLVTNRMAIKDRKAAVEQTRRDRSREAAERLARVIATEWPNLAMTGHGVIADYGKFQLEIGLERPMLDDTYLAQRVQNLQDYIADLLAYIASTPIEEEAVVPRTRAARAKMISVRNRYTLAVGFYVVWVRESLAAHALGEALPPKDPRKVCEMPELPIPDDI